MSPRLLRPVLAVAALAALAVTVSLTPAQATGRALHGPGHAAAAGTPQRPPRPAYVPRIKHVFVINIENKGYDETFGDGSAAPYLTTTLRQKGVLLTEYHGTAHNSLPNYIAQISGQAPNPSTQLDCQTYSAFTAIGPNQSPQQKVGSGCVYPAGVRTLPWQLTHRDLTWRGYMQQMGTSCRHPKLGAVDQTQHATPGHNYAVRHNPFMYFASIVDRGRYCKHHVKDLSRLPQDLKRAGTTRNLTYITPDLCRDGHDDPCADKSAGGLPQVNDFLKKWVPQILQSPAYRRNGMLVITADESDSPVTDSSACCGETSGPNVAQAGITGPGGGLTGALVISRFTSKNSWSTTPYNHYSLLASLEEIFRLPKIGMAKVPTLPVFGLDVYNNGWWNP